VEIRTEYHKLLRGIQDDVLQMGSLVSEAITLAVDALKERNTDLAKQVIENDTRIDSLRYDIEDKCLRLIATQQPLAVDLRVVISVLSIITDLERIGDHAEGIASITVMIGDEPPLKPLIDIPRMAERATDMLMRSLDAFIKRDAETAAAIVGQDDEVDHLYNQVFRELLSYMMEDPRTISRATRLIWVAHNLERSADRITNICERVVFLVKGKINKPYRGSPKK
jgi:phosphate transport system protein